MAGGFASLLRSVPARAGEVGQGWRVIVRLTAAPALAWLLSMTLFGHSQAFFAPIVAILTLTVGVGKRASVLVEIILGAALGILVGELLILLIGRGAWQLVLVVALAVACAIFLRLSGLALTQTVISSVLLVAIVPEAGVADPALTRFVDAFLGGATALAMTILVPANPIRDLDRATGRMVRELAAILKTIAGAMRNFDTEHAAVALDRARATQPMVETLGAQAGGLTEIARLSPFRWSQRASVNARAAALVDLEHAVRNTRVLARRTAAMIRNGEPVPAPIVAAVEDLAQIALVTPKDPEALIGVAEQAVSAATLELTINTAAIASQIRAIVADMLLASGVDYASLDELLDFG